MREIKFRAWDNKKQIFHYNIEIYGVYQPVFDDMEELSFEDFILDKDRFIVNQYTGLKDKNGKEIYEGDILKGKSNDYINGYYSPVEFYAGSFHVTVVYDLVMIPLSGFPTVWIENGCVGNEETSIWIAEFEVIGNIHQNPELLK